MAQLFTGQIIQKTPQACLVDITPPTFGGITSLTPQPNGALRASCSAASDATPPLEYLYFIQAGTAVGLFNSSNLVLISPLTTIDIYVDALNNPLSAQTYYVGVWAKDGMGNVSSNVVSISAASVGIASNSIFNQINTIPAQVWAALRNANNVSGSFGEALQAKVDVDVSTRLAASGYTAPDNADIAAIKAKTDNLPVDPASESNVSAVGSAVVSVGSQVTLVKAKTDNLPSDPASNSTVLTRLASSGYTPPDNASISAIKVQTDKFQFDINNYVLARTVILDDKTNLTLAASTVSLITGGVWEEMLANHSTSGSFGANAQNPPLNSAQIASAVWDALTSQHAASGTFGAVTQNPPLSASQIASAVWDALTVNYSASGSFGSMVQTPSINPTQVANAVWDALTAAHVVSGSFGEALGGFSMDNVNRAADALNREIANAVCGPVAKIVTNNVQGQVGQKQIKGVVIDVDDVKC